MWTLKCKQCLNPIKSTNIDFCSLRCKQKWYKNKHTNKCVVCKSLFVKRTSKSRPIRFCSNKCKFEYQRDNPPRPRTGHNKKCLACGKKFYVAKWQDFYQYCNIKCFNDYKTKCIANGDLMLFGKYKHGKYKSKMSGKTESYDSSYELIRMKQLDEMRLPWTKKHSIVIPYKSSNGVWKNYIPDFLINGNIVEEVKPLKCIESNFNNAKLKINAARKFCKLCGYAFHVITESKLNI